MSEAVSVKLGDRPAFPIKLLLIDPDPIYRTGLRVVLSQFADLQVVAEAENSATALQVLSLTSDAGTVRSLGVDLILLDLNIDFSQSSDLSQLQFRGLRSQYPKVPVLLFTFPLAEPEQLTALRAIGVDGYCPKGIAVAQLVTAIEQVAAGRSYWVEKAGVRSQESEESRGAAVQGGSGAQRQGSRGAAGQRGRGAEGQRGDQREFLIQNPKSVLESLALRKPTPPRQLPQRREPPHSTGSTFRKIQNSPRPSLLAQLRDRLRISGLRQIDTSIAQVTAQLQPGLTLVEQAILAGQRRELLASRWLVNKLLATAEDLPQKRAGEQRSTLAEEHFSREAEERIANYQLPITNYQLPITNYDSSVLSANTLPSSLFTSVREKLQRGLENLTRVPLETDILSEEKKRELLNLILLKVENILTDLRFSQVPSSQLAEMRFIIARDLWQATTTDFFGKYSTLQLGDRQLEIVSILLQDAAIVQTAILDKIPLTAELFSYLLFATDLVIYNTAFPASSPEARERAEILLQNLLIQVANAVVQPLLNHFADIEIIKQNYYDKRLISTREVERFRNDLSWKYRLETYIGEPKKIFESRYELFLLVSRGIAKTSIYAPRNRELTRLSGIPLVVTLALEFRDAIAPRLRAVVEFFGNGIVYLLTQVVGRAIGLIGRGILQGLGGSLQESKNKKF